MDQKQFDFTKQPGLEQKRELYTETVEPLVSIITPFYNAGKYFEQTFWSVINQTFPWFEWVIVDDGSTQQEDVEILHKFAAMDSRIRVITQENMKQSRARNNAVANAVTELILTLDADDVIDPTYIECLYWALYYNPDAAWCYSNSYGFEEIEYIWKRDFNAETLKTYNFLNYTALIRKKDFLEIGGYKVEKWAYHEDWRFWLDMLAAGKKPVHINTCLFWYRRLNTGMMSTVNGNSELIQFSEEIIKNAAKNVDGTIQALEYPISGTKYPFCAPRKIEWNRKTYKTHNQKRVLWLIPWLTMGGADKFNLDAITGLQEKGIRNFILTTEISENDWHQKFEDATDEIFHLPDFLDPAHYLEFVSYFVQSREIDAIMVSNSYDGYYMIPWLRQHFPDVAIVDYVHMEEWYWRKGGFARVSGVQDGLSEKTWVCNSATRDVMIDHFGRKPEDVECMYIGVDHYFFDAAKTEPGYLHKMLNLEPERPIVLFPCRIHPQKRPFMMPVIAQQVIRQVPNAAFVVVGDGPQLEELIAFVHNMGLDSHVFCIGRSGNMRECYRDSALTLICSLKEGLALTAYESLSMGVPVVSSDVGGQRDLIGDDVGALLPLMQSEEQDLDSRTFPEEEVALYVEHIVRILQDPALRRQLGENGRKKIVAGFSIEKMVEQLYSELTELCEDRTLLEKRRSVSQALQLTRYFATDYYTIYQQWKTQQDQCEEVWKARCWFEQKYKEAQAECEEVWKARCWFEQKYLEAARNPSRNFFGKCYEKVRKLLGRIYRKLTHA